MYTTKKYKLEPKDPALMKQFEKLCGLLCTEEEIADFFEVDDKTLRWWCYLTYGESSFCTLYKRFSHKGKMRLRAAQLKLAEKSASMAIWLGKQWLGQTDPDKEEKETKVVEDWTPILEMLKDDGNSNN